jgi:hypothetical protein
MQMQKCDKVVFFKKDDILNKDTNNSLLQQLRDLIRRGVNFNQTFTRAIAEEHEGMSPLALACSHQKQDFVQVIFYIVLNVVNITKSFAYVNHSRSIECFLV